MAVDLYALKIATEKVEQIQSTLTALDEATAAIQVITPSMASLDSIVNNVIPDLPNINTVAGLSAEIASLVTDKATLDSIYADKTTLDTLYAMKAKLDSLYADKTKLDSLYADKTTLDTLYTNLATINDALNQANIATTQAGIATTQANLATTKYTEFDDRYLGAKATPPTLDNNGNSLVTGAMFFDTTANQMKVYDGSIWKLAGSSVSGITENIVHTPTAGQTVFNCTYNVGFVYVYVNGIRLAPSDYIATSGTSITLNTGVSTTDVVETVAFGTFEVADAYTKLEVDNKDTATLNSANSYTDGQVALKQDILVANDPAVKTALNASGSAPIYACRAWVNFNGTGTVAIRASGNVSSITDNGVGNYTVNFITAMEDNNFCAVLGGVTAGIRASVYISQTVSPNYISILQAEAGVASYDCIEIHASVFR